MRISKFLILLLLFCTVTLIFPSRIFAENWLTGFSYRKQLTINNGSGGDLSNYQIELSLNEGSGTDSGFDLYLDNNVQSSFEDIRFTTSDGSTLLDYWIEDISSGTATVWVEFDSLSSSSDSTFYLYYGNSSASSLSSANNTFQFFDNFDTDGIDNWTGANGNLNVGETATQTLSTSLYVSSPNSAQLTTYANCNVSPWDGVRSRLTQNMSIPSGNYLVEFSTRRAITGFRYTTTANQYSIVRINGAGLYSVNSTCNGNGCTTVTDWYDASFTVSDSVITSVGIEAYSGDCTDGYTNFDNMIIRSYSATAPTMASVGGIEESQAEESSSNDNIVTPTPIPSNDTSCSNQKPSEAPTLHSVSRQGNDAQLYFVPVKNNNDGYVINYGTTDSAGEFSDMFDWSDTSGMVPRVIHDVDQSRSWYFKVRGKNGCAAGDWSNTVALLLSSPSPITTPLQSLIKSSSATGVPSPKPSPTSRPTQPPATPTATLPPQPTTSPLHDLTTNVSQRWKRIHAQMTNQQQKLTTTVELVSKVSQEQNASIQNKVSLTRTALANIWLDQAGTTISNVRVAEATPTTATIEWETNHLATGKVNWGDSYDYGQSLEHTDLTTHHRITINGLKPNQTYYYEVMSQGKNYVYDARHEFVTAGE